MKEFKCRNNGKNCDWIACGETETEVLEQVLLHGQRMHGFTDFSEEVQDHIRTKIHDTPPRLRPGEDERIDLLGYR